MCLYITGRVTLFVIENSWTINVTNGEGQHNAFDMPT